MLCMVQLDSNRGNKGQKRTVTTPVYRMGWVICWSSCCLNQNKVSGGTYSHGQGTLTMIWCYAMERSCGEIELMVGG